MEVLVLTRIIFFVVAVTRTCAENSTDITGMFKLLLSSADKMSRLFVPLTLPYQQGVHKDLGEDTVRIADP